MVNTVRFQFDLTRFEKTWLLRKTVSYRFIKYKSVTFFMKLHKHKSYINFSRTRTELVGKFTQLSISGTSQVVGQKFSTVKISGQFCVTVHMNISWYEWPDFCLLNDSCNFRTIYILINTYIYFNVKLY